MSVLPAMGVVALLGLTGVAAQQHAYEAERTQQLRKFSERPERPWRPFMTSERSNCPEFTRGRLIFAGVRPHFNGDVRAEWWDSVSGQYLQQTVTNAPVDFGQNEATQ